MTCSADPAPAGNGLRSEETATVRRARRLLPLVPVLGSCVVSLVLLRAELRQAPYLNDSAMAEEMVRVALAKIRTGHFPPDSWFPYLNLGSPQYLHYQSLAAMATALLAWGIGVGRAFTLTTWLLVSCWPLCIYGAARLFGLRRGAAVAAALLSPFISSATGVGYEQISYLWAGYGLWSQLFAMWTLPLAWACSWRAVEERRFVVLAAVLVAATAAFHFETGYLAFVGVVVFVCVRPSQFLRRAGRGLLVMGGAFGLAAWAIVPLVAQGKWAAINEFLQSGPEGTDANSYGAGRVLSWLVDGGLLDWHHLLLLTPLCAVGLLVAIASWRGRGAQWSIDSGIARALIGLFLVSLVLFFGRPTLGPFLDLLPGAKDLFLRRFLVGVQLAGLLLAGVGVATLARLLGGGLHHLLSRRPNLPTRVAQVVPTFVLGCLALVALVPSWSFLVDQASRNSALITEQSAASVGAHQLDALVQRISRGGAGRVFAGDPSDWGTGFRVGEVPVFKYLASLDVDEVGFTLRTASLMSDPENEFDETSAADYAAFGIRWLLLPASMQPPVPATFVERRGSYALSEIRANGYVQIVDTLDSVHETANDLGSFSASFLVTLPAADPIYPTVAYGDGTAPQGTLAPGAQPLGRPGAVRSERADLADGTVTATVSLKRTAVVLLSTSYDPGWQATVDGRPVATEMVAPALIGVRVGPGTHTIRFLYRGFPDYPQFGIVGTFVFVALVVIERRRRHGARSRIAPSSTHE